MHSGKSSDLQSPGSHPKICSNEKQLLKKVVRYASVQWCSVTELKYGTILKRSTDFADLSKIYWVLKKKALISIEALICGYLEPKNLSAKPPNKVAMPL